MSINSSLKNVIPYFPAILAALLFALLQFSRLSGVGPGLLFFAMAIGLFPVTAVFSILCAGQGNRLASLWGALAGLAGVGICCMLVWGTGDQLGLIYSSTLAATMLGTLAGRISGFRKS